MIIIMFVKVCEWKILMLSSSIGQRRLQVKWFIIINYVQSKMLKLYINIIRVEINLMNDEFYMNLNLFISKELNKWF